MPMRLNLSEEPVVVTIVEGVTMTFRPLRSDLVQIANLRLREASREEVAENDVEEEEYGLGIEARAASNLAWMQELAAAAILEWDGFVDVDDSAMEPSRAAVSAAVALPPVMAAFEAQYVIPGYMVVTEGNGSKPSQTGTSGAE